MFRRNLLSSSSGYNLSPFTQKMSIEGYSETFGNRILTARFHTAKVTNFLCYATEIFTVLQQIGGKFCSRTNNLTINRTEEFAASMCRAQLKLVIPYTMKMEAARYQTTRFHIRGGFTVHIHHREYLKSQNIWKCCIKLVMVMSIPKLLHLIIHVHLLFCMKDLKLWKLQHIQSCTLDTPKYQLVAGAQCI